MEKDRRQAGRQARSRHRHQPRLLPARARPPRPSVWARRSQKWAKKAMIALREPSLGPVFGIKGGAAGGRLRAGRSDGGHQSALHRRHARDHRGEQPALRHARQPHAAGQRARHRSAPRRFHPRHGYERPRAAQHHDRSRRQGKRRAARGSLHDHGRVRGHGHPVSGEGSRRPQEALRRYSRRVHLCRQAGLCARPAR